MTADLDVKNASTNELQPPTCAAQMQGRRFLGMTEDKGNVILLGLGMCLVFLGFNVTQGLQTTVNKDLGFKSLSLLYLSFSTTNLFAPTVVRVIGIKPSILTGTCLYLSYIVANIKLIVPIYLASSVFLGLGASLVWTSQGAMVARCSDDNTIGRNLGLFFSIFFFHGVVGFGGASYMLHMGVSVAILFVTLSVCVLFGIFLLSFLKTREKDYREALKSAGVKSKSFGRHVMDTFALFGNGTMLLLLLPMIHSGFSQTLYYGLIGPEVGESYVTMLLCLFSGTDALGSVLLGKLSDKIGRSPIMAWTFVGGYAGLASLYYADSSTIWRYFLGAGILGTVDAATNTQVSSVLACRFPHNQEAAFGFFKLVQATTTGLGFYLSHITDFDQELMGIGGILFLAFPMFLFANVSVNKFQRQRNYTSVSSDTEGPPAPGPDSPGPQNAPSTNITSEPPPPQPQLVPTENASPERV